MPDKYDEAIDYLTKNPDKIIDAWGFPDFALGGCLFQFAGDAKGKINCLTAIRGNDYWVAETPELTLEIRADERIPKSIDKIRVEDIPVFAEWQRRLDRELISRQN